MLHDVICMANNLSDILFVILQAPHRKKNTRLGKSFSLNQTAIDVIVIRNDRNIPYFLTEHYQGAFANNIYVRIMDTNTPKNASADIKVL